MRTVHREHSCLRRDVPDRSHKAIARLIIATASRGCRVSSAGIRHGTWRHTFSSKTSLRWVKQSSRLLVVVSSASSDGVANMEVAHLTWATRAPARRLRTPSPLMSDLQTQVNGQPHTYRSPLHARGALRHRRRGHALRLTAPEARCLAQRGQPHHHPEDGECRCRSKI